MELGLNDAVSILSVIKTLDWWSITLWLSLIVPLYYIAIKKLIPAQPNDTSTTLLQRLNNVLTLPKAENWVLAFSVVLFVTGNIIAVIGQQYKEAIRNEGWALKNHMVNAGFFTMSIHEITVHTHINENHIRKITSQYPNEFSMVYDSSGNPKAPLHETVILSDPAAKEFVLCRNEKILAAYLNNNAVLVDSGLRNFDTLFKQNPLFTYPVIYKLIADSSARFTMNFTDVNDWNKGFAIVKLPRPGCPPVCPK